jgi:FemAB-related protein (PEP-CTERM system-associated)
MSTEVVSEPVALSRLIAPLSPVSDDQWDRFVGAQPGASAYHYSGWARLIGRTFGHDVRMLAAGQDGRITGVLPLVVMRSRLFGRFAISLPFLNAGGVLATDAASERALLEGAIEIARNERVEYLELRHTRRSFPALVERRHRVAMSMPLAETGSAQWEVIDRKIRNQVRKAEKSGLRVEQGGAELVPPFYEVFRRNMRELGTPVFPQRLFNEALTTFPANTRVVCIYKDSLPIAGGIIHWRDAWAEVIWASALREYNPLCPNILLYWQMMTLAIERGCRMFEFGRCRPGEGTFHFKKQWGAQPSELVWEYWTPSGQAVFDASPKNPKFASAVQVWRKLPLGLTSAIGPRIVRGIPC